MASDPIVPQAPLVGQRILSEGLGTSEQSLFLAGPDGAFCNQVIAYGNGTAPGTGEIVYRLKKSGVTTTVWRFPLVNQAHTQQPAPGQIDLPAGAELRIAAEPGLPAGAELHFTAMVRTYGSEFTYTPSPEE
jgi:hypothetical protein